MARPKGIPNKNTRGLLAELKRQFGKDYHPIIEMARVANDENETPERRFAANKEVAQYVVPKLKAVEHTGETKHVLLTVAEQIKAAENASDSAD